MLPIARRRRLNMRERGRKIISSTLILQKFKRTCYTRKVGKFCHIFVLGRLPAVNLCLKTSYRATIQVLRCIT